MARSRQEGGRSNSGIGPERASGGQDTREDAILVETRRAEVTRWTEVQRTYRAHLEALSLTLHPFNIDDATAQTSTHAVLTETLKAIRMNATDDGAVFCNRNGAPYKSFRSAFEKAVHKAALVDFTFHDLRHTFASRLAMAGVDLATVKELMGHKDISMTIRYAHLSAEHKQHAVRQLERFGHGVPTKVPTVAQEPTEGRLQVIEKAKRPLSSAG